MREGVTAAVRRHTGELAISATALVAGVIVLAARAGELADIIGGALAAGGPIGAGLSIYYTEGDYRRRVDEAADAERERVEREHSEMSRIAQLARGILLDTELWRDVLAFHAHVDAQRANPGREIPEPPAWSVAAILARGRDALEPMRVRGWSQIADALRSHATHLQNVVDQEFPGQPAERRSELRGVFTMVEAAAKDAQWLYTVTNRRAEAQIASQEDQRTADDAVRDAASSFFAALEGIRGSIESIERAEEFARIVAETDA